MSAAEDVREMQTLANEIADYMAGTGALLKQRIGAVLKAINADASEPITDNRALEFLKGRARMVHAWERANADRQLRELKQREEAAREHAHVLWLQS
jgi:hypothetical protein